MPQLTVVTPSYREAQNIPILFERLKAVLSGFDWELIVVDDDSPDGTSDVARNLAQQDKRVRIIQGFGRRGLSGAVMKACSHRARQFWL